MPGLFVTATGTEIGKTFVTAGLLRAGRRARLAMDALKPVMSGFDPGAPELSDAGQLLSALGRPVTAAEIARIAPFRFAAPLAPDMAAAAEGRSLDFPAIVAACRAAILPDRLTLIEGVGGVMVPLSVRHTVRDLIVELALPVVLVSGTALGAISHCLAAREALRGRGVDPMLIVMNCIADTHVPLDAMMTAIQALVPDCPIVSLPREAQHASFDRLFAAYIGAFV